MEKSSLRGILILLSIAGLLAPASEMIGKSVSQSAGSVPPSAGSVEKPRLTPDELRRAIEAIEKQASDTRVQEGVQERLATPARDPFSLPPLLVSAESPLPEVRLLGIVGSGDRGVATLVVAGQAVTVQVGQEVNGDRLPRVSPPDGAEVEIRGQRVGARVGR